MNRPLLAIDTATRRACLAIGDGRGRALAERGWDARERHAETLLDELDALLAEVGLRPADLGGIVAGIGPGAFTGLRVGLATAKTLAHGLGLPIAGLATTAALALAAARAAAARYEAARDLAAGNEAAPEGAAPAAPRARVAAPLEVIVLLPAGPNGVYVARYRVTRAPDGRPIADVVVEAIEPPRLAGPAEAADLAAESEAAGLAAASEAAGSGEAVPWLRVAVDLEPQDVLGSAGLRVPPATLERGRRAAAGLGAALLILGAARLAGDGPDDVAALVPGYVSLPRGAPVGGEAWSPDLR
ncbi:MAG TPA: tRNA (adenosine(37)-N6)-threonylcarbamoyltransferase complex dimerization subunit type 1 TsaB [Candidatus Limnocylindrales bacterium]|nr:tRNA (adenosine(37)-N6)-threonylcarbamoyltransferase complex dimerization subunit type 1 TsaB [Candidatus Limnocylindrales bacterium]